MPKPISSNAIALQLRRARNAMEIPLSYFQLRAENVAASRRLNLHDRKVIRELLPLLDIKHLTVFDIGLHDGSYTNALLALPNVDMIVGFEPHPNTFEKARLNLGDDSRVRMYNIGLGEERGSLPFNVNKAVASSSFLRMREDHVKLFPYTGEAETISVGIDRLDDVVERESLPWPSLIKMDVQGYEDRVLKGGEATFGHAEWLITELNFAALYEEAVLAAQMIALLHERGWYLVSLSEPLIGPKGAWASANGLFGRRPLKMKGPKTFY